MDKKNEILNKYSYLSLFIKIFYVFIIYIKEIFEKKNTIYKNNKT